MEPIEWALLGWGSAWIAVGVYYIVEYAMNN